MKKRSVVLFGHPTSVSLEEEFWDAFKRIANNQQTSMHALIKQIDETRITNLSSAIRVFILKALEENVNQVKP